MAQSFSATPSFLKDPPCASSCSASASSCLPLASQLRSRLTAALRPPHRTVRERKARCAAALPDWPAQRACIANTAPGRASAWQTAQALAYVALKSAPSSTTQSAAAMGRLMAMLARRPQPASASPRKVSVPQAETGAKAPQLALPQAAGEAQQAVSGCVHRPW